MIKYLIFYFIGINILASFITILDKIKAKHNKWRIKESTLITLAVAGGSIGEYITMLIIRHKTKHKKFTIGIPLIITIQIIIFYIVLKFAN